MADGRQLVTDGRQGMVLLVSTSPTQQRQPAEAHSCYDDDGRCAEGNAF